MKLFSNIRIFVPVYKREGCDVDELGSGDVRARVGERDIVLDIECCSPDSSSIYAERSLVNESMSLGGSANP